MTPGPGETRRDLRLAGGVATTVALSLLWVASGSFEGAAFPPSSLAEAILRATPGDVATFFIEQLQHLARPLLVTGVVVATLVLGAETLARTAAGSRPRPYVAASLLFSISLIAVAVGPDDDVSWVSTAAALAVAALCYGLVGSLLTGERSDRTVDEGRRRALRLGVGGAVGVAVAGGAAGWVARRLGGPDTNVPLVAPKAAASIPPRAAFPDVPGLSPEVTSADDHYVVDINLVQPSVEADGWSLEVGGLVDEPLRFSFASLQERFEVVEEYAVLACISNEVGGDLIGNSAWGGVRLRDVLDAAGVRAGAVDVVFHGADRYTDSITLEDAMDPSVLLAVSQNGQPLQREHGFPCRVRIPRIYGMKNVKWLERIEVVDRDYQGYWMERGWSDIAEVRTESRIDVPTRSADLKAGAETWIGGIAWAGDRGISKVEVSTDGGKAWEEALLKEPIGRFAWTQWALKWTPGAAGSYTLACRATDGRGKTQTAAIAPPHPAGATGYHFKEVTVG